MTDDTGQSTLGEAIQAAQDGESDHGLTAPLLTDAVEQFFEDTNNLDEQVDALNELRATLHEVSPFSEPVEHVKWVDQDDVEGNDYNPNEVATPEMDLLHKSIKEDGYTQPIVTYEVEDGESCGMSLPCGHTPTFKGENVGDDAWNVLKGVIPNHQSTSLDIPLDSSTVRVLSGKPTRETADTESKSDKATKMGEENSVSGSRTSGGSEISMTRTGTAFLASGTSPGSTTSNTYLIIVCPTCESKTKEHGGRWISFESTQTVGEMENGLNVKCSISASTETSTVRQILPKNWIEQETPFEPNADSSASVRLENSGSRYEVVDGFHRMLIGKTRDDIRERLHDHVPVTVIDKSREERMSSTIRHNRARGTHQIRDMSDLVVELYDRGWDDERIGEELGMEIDEVLKLKQASGLKKAFGDHEFSQSWTEYEERYGVVEGEDDAE